MNGGEEPIKEDVVQQESMSQDGKQSDNEPAMVKNEVIEN